MAFLPDEGAARRDWLALLVLAALAMLVKVPTLGAPAFWDETAWLGQAGWLAGNGLLKAVPGLRPDAMFFGHPPGLHVAAAVLFKVFGHSIEVAHILIACLSAAGVCATWVLVRAWHDMKTAVLAALLLLFSPAWFSSAGVFLADLPVATLGVLSAVFVTRGRLMAFMVTASCMVLIKETAVSLVVALVVFRLVSRRPVTRGTLREALPWLTPLLVFGAFIAVQKVATGRFFYIYDFATNPLFDFGIASSTRQAWQITHWMFIAQFRWVMTGAIVANLAMSPLARRHPEFLLLAIVALASGYAFSVLFYIPRYVLPVLPFLYAAGAVSLMSLARTPIRQLGTATVATALTLWALVSDPYRGHGEDNLQYLGIVRLHQEAVREVVARHGTARLLAGWPIAAELSNPLLGYVSAPLRVKWFAGEEDLVASDIAIISWPSNADADRFEALVRTAGWQVLSTRQHGVHVVTIYERPGARGGGGGPS